MDYKISTDNKKSSTEKKGDEEDVLMINRLPTQHLEPLVDFNLKKVKSALIARFICSFIESVKHAEAFAVLEIE